MKKIYMILFLTVIILIAIALVIQTRKRPQVHTASLDQGKKLYSTYCTRCHGDLGKGDGDLAYLLYPKPRNFTRGMFKIRSTPSGTVPTDQDLIKTVKSGMPGTAMPSFYYLKQTEVEQIVAYVKSLSQDCPQGQPCKSFFENQKTETVQIPKPIPSSSELISRGKALYTQLGCHQCHGELGKGDGPSSAGLKDGWGYPIKVRDFTRGVYLGGGKPEDLYLRFATGLDGTPMPSYKDNFQYLGKTEQERQELIWGLVYYVKRLERKNDGPAATTPQNGIIQANKTKDSVSDQEFIVSDNAIWNQATSYSIPLSRLWQKDETNAEPVEIRAVYNQDYVAIRLEWNDDTFDAGNYRLQDFQDAAAVQFSLSDTPGFHGMGASKTPTNIWFWRSEWQMRKDSNQTPDIQKQYVQAVVDSGTENYPKEIRDTTALSGRDAQNPVSKEKIISAVEDINAAGPGTLTSQPPEQQNVLGKGISDGKHWRVVFLRKREVRDENDVKFDASRKACPIAFAIWNGSERDRNGQKFVSTWYNLKFEN